MPFAHVAQELARFRRVAVSEATATRHTVAAGAAWVALQTAEVERRERELPEPPAGPAVQQVSAEGAMVPRGGGEGAAGKTVASGTVEAPSTDGREGQPEGHTRERSSCSRLAAAETCARLALVELQRRGTERAGVVGAPLDGADWEQAFLDRHRPAAVRILDCPPALEHLAPAAQATCGAGPPTGSAWLGEQARTLQHGEPDQVLPAAQATDPAAAAQARDATVPSLEKRREQLRYAEFQALGYPIGSGSIESANKRVVEARRKGRGRHWARPPAPRRPAPLPRTGPQTIVEGRPTAEHPWKKDPLLSPSRRAKT